jgi:hypothetical protein
MKAIKIGLGLARPGGLGGLSLTVAKLLLVVSRLATMGRPARIWRAAND